MGNALQQALVLSEALPRYYKNRTANVVATLSREMLLEFVRQHGVISLSVSPQVEEAFKESYKAMLRSGYVIQRPKAGDEFEIYKDEIESLRQLSEFDYLMQEMFTPRGNTEGHLAKIVASGENLKRIAETEHNKLILREACSDDIPPDILRRSRAIISLLEAEAITLDDAVARLTAIGFDVDVFEYNADGVVNPRG